MIRPCRNLQRKLSGSSLCNNTCDKASCCRWCTHWLQWVPLRTSKESLMRYRTLGWSTFFPDPRFQIAYTASFSLHLGFSVLYFLWKHIEHQIRHSIILFYICGGIHELTGLFLLKHEYASLSCCIPGPSCEPEQKTLQTQKNNSGSEGHAGQPLKPRIIPSVWIRTDYFP